MDSNNYANIGLGRQELVAEAGSFNEFKHVDLHAKRTDP